VSNDAVQSSSEGSTTDPEAPRDCMDQRLPVCSYEIIREIETYLTVGRSVLLDGSPSEIQSSTAFTVDMLKNVIEVIQGIAMKTVKSTRCDLAWAGCYWLWVQCE
jgi:hypothetical protein